MTMDRQDAEIFFRMLRAFRGGNQTEFAAEVGVDPSSIGRYETGDQLPLVPTRKRLIAGAGIPEDIAEAFLPPVIRLLRGVMGPAHDRERQAVSTGPKTWTALGEDRLVEDLRVAAAAALRLLEGALAAHGSGAGAAGERAEAKPLAMLPTLTERLCDASVRAAADKASDAVELASMAVRAVKLADGGKAWKRRLLGWARAFLANALRVSGDFRRADVEFTEAWRLWHASRDGDPDGRLPEWRLLDLEASLRREQLRFPEALALLERARQVAPPEAAARLLVSTAFTLEQTGDFSAAVEMLREAALRLDESSGLRERFAVAFNLVSNLCGLESFPDAQEGLAKVGELAKALANELDSVRVVWLSARVNLGLGNVQAARGELEQVRAHFVGIRHGIAAAVVSLELAAIDLEAGRTAEVKALAQGMAWIFSTEGLDRDALAALRLFCDAALKEEATIAQARQLLTNLDRSRQLAAGRRT